MDASHGNRGFDSRPSDFFFTRGNGTKTRQEQIEEMLHDLNDVVIWLDNDADIERIMPVIYWLEAELKEETEKSDDDWAN